MALRILYNSQDPSWKEPFGVLTPLQPCTMKLAVPMACQPTQVVLILQKEDGSVFREFEFARDQEEEPYSYFKVGFSISKPGLFFYYFRITTLTGQFRLFRQGYDTNMEAGDLWQLSCVAELDPVPEEYLGRVFYQIFPDRFNQAGTCDCKDKLRPYWVHEDKSEMPVFQPDEHGEMQNNDFYGGNLNGIRERLPYLQNLGVGALYLNPICMAFSSHRYDTADYKRIDPMLGTDADFAALCDEAHKRGMKIILDAVFSHTGSNSRYFDAQGIFGNGAVSNPNSPYRRWYTFQNYPKEYTSWWNFKTLPCVNKLEPSFMDFIFGSDDSVVANWIRLGADGLRLDVVDELPDVFLSKLRRRLRDLNPRAFLIGEVWEDASNKIAYGVRRQYFTENQIDSVMNYPWRKAILDFARGDDDGNALRWSVMSLAENYPAAVLQANLNLLSSHDVPRVITALIDSFDGEREELAERMASMTPELLALGKARYRLASFLQFMLPGCPCIYYGDEAGMTGFRDPFNRQYYPWGREDCSLQQHIAELAQLKNSRESLRRGNIEILAAGNGHFAFRRCTPKESLSLWCNTAKESWQITQPGICLLGTRLLGPLRFCAILES